MNDQEEHVLTSFEQLASDATVFLQALGVVAVPARAIRGSERWRRCFDLYESLGDALRANKPAFEGTMVRSRNGHYLMEQLWATSSVLRRIGEST